MITTIIFDYYGVFQPDIYVEWLNSNGLERTGILDDLAKQLDHGELSQQEFVEKLSETLQRPVTFDEIYSREIAIDQQVVSLARSLHSSYKLGLLSNASSALHQKLKDNKIEDLFDAITISSDVGIAKPAKEIYLHTLEKLHSQPAETIYIDDNPRYMEAGKVVGLDTIRFISTSQLRKDLRHRRITF